MPSLLARAANALTTSHGRSKRLVVIFLRGAADGLNMVVPHGEPAYYAMRPTINIPRSAVIDLDGFFGFHPAMSSLEPLWQEGQLAIVHATGSPHPSREHFVTQDFMESGILRRAKRDQQLDESLCKRRGYVVRRDFYTRTRF